MFVRGYSDLAHCLLRECLVEEFSSGSCPNCASNITTQDASGLRILCSVHNEGGLQENLDIMPALLEEAYLKLHPLEMKQRAFLELCRNGDLPAIIEMLKETQDDENADDSGNLDMNRDKVFFVDMLSYRDPIGDQFSALHCAVQGKSREVVWLLLLLASDLDLHRFPAAVIQEAAALGLGRDDVVGRSDLRSFRDALGRTAEQLAFQHWPSVARLVESRIALQVMAIHVRAHVPLPRPGEVKLGPRIRESLNERGSFIPLNS